MKASKVTNADLTKWAAEKYLAGRIFYCGMSSCDEYHLSKNKEIFNPINSFDHLMMIVESEKFPEFVGLGIWKDHCHITTIKEDLTVSPMRVSHQNLGWKLLEILYEMEGEDRTGGY